jgi:hypothetical protein
MQGTWNQDLVDVAEPDVTLEFLLFVREQKR